MYEIHAKAIEKAEETIGKDPIAKVELLLDAVRSWSGSGALEPWGVVESKLNLFNLDAWILQAKKDPSFSQDVIKGWADTLEAHIHNSLKRFECAKLFGKLFDEWTASGDSVTPVNIPNADSTASFEEVGRKELHEQKKKLSSLIFEAAATDSDSLTSYLTDLFSSEPATKALDMLRYDVRVFATELQRTPLDAKDIIWIIDSLLASALMDETKRLTLREFKENPIALDEVASVMNLRIASLGSWSWPQEGIAIEMRRHLNGKYRAFTDPDILDALFLEYIGCRWQVEFKKAFQVFASSKAWKPSITPLSASAQDRRKFFLKEYSVSSNIEASRRRTRETHFLAGQLRSDVMNIASGYDDAPSDGEDADLSTPASSLKQILLHLMTTDSLLDNALYESHTIVRTDFEWFGPSLPHSSILTLLAFWGVPQNWLNFFEVFLCAPLKFQDEPSSATRIRKRGTPFSHALSALCGEAVMFAMDFAVNQRADGLFLYRIHDDLWFWDSDVERCVKAWQEMKQFASLVGLKFNNEKTGSACVGVPAHPDLPTGDIRWGFLKFQSEKSRLVIDQQEVDIHIIELRRQLAATKSVFGWINVYNKYMAFLVRNFGRPCQSFGLRHIEDIIDTLGRIQRELFPGTSDGVIGHLRSVIGERFGIRDLPEGYFWFPVGSGGLGLRNPMVEQFATMNTMTIDPEGVFTYELFQDVTRYKELSEKFEKTYVPPTGIYYPRSRPAFMSYDEYIANRETCSGEWNKAYQQMMATPTWMSIEIPLVLQNSSSWDTKDLYEKWIVSLYGDELMKKFGTLEVVDPALIPVGLVQLLKNSRLKWEQ